MLPKLEGTTHVNMALIIKFIKNYFFGHVSYPDVPQKSEAVDDAYLFRQNSGGLGEIRFGDYRRAFADESLSNILLFQKQIDLFKKLISETPPTEAQQKNVDFMLANGELFTLIAYGQLILENARIYAVKPALKNQIFGFLIRDFSEYALKMILNHAIEPAQETIYQQMIMKADADPAGLQEVWTQDVLPLKDAYRMKN
jgi:acyl-CoA dehydrogenase